MGGKDLIVVMRRQEAGFPAEASTCWLRIMMASAKPRSSMTIATITYMIPRRLWSTEVSHSFHR